MWVILLYDVLYALILHLVRKSVEEYALFARFVQQSMFQKRKYQLSSSEFEVDNMMQCQRIVDHQMLLDGIGFGSSKNFHRQTHEKSVMTNWRNSVEILNSDWDTCLYDSFKMFRNKPLIPLSIWKAIKYKKFNLIFPHFKKHRQNFIAWYHLSMVANHNKDIFYF